MMCVCAWIERLWFCYFYPEGKCWLKSSFKMHRYCWSLFEDSFWLILVNQVDRLVARPWQMFFPCSWCFCSKCVNRFYPNMENLLWWKVVPDLRGGFWHWRFYLYKNSHEHTFLAVEPVSRSKHTLVRLSRGSLASLLVLSFVPVRPL